VRASVKAKAVLLRRTVELNSEQGLSPSNTPYQIQQIKLDVLLQLLSYRSHFSNSNNLPLLDGKSESHLQAASKF
jgi:hypothetical protein